MHLIVETLIPLFLAVSFPVEDRERWEHGAKYIFAVHMNMTRTPRCSNLSCRGHLSDTGFVELTSRLHCYPTEDNSLVCSLRQAMSSDIMWKEDTAKVHQKIVDTVTDAPFELLFDDNGIERVIASLQTKPYDLNILKTVAEQLHIGDNLDDEDRALLPRTARSTIGRCNVSYEIHRHPLTEIAESGFLLQPLQRELRVNYGETIVIDKITHLDECSSHAESYFCRYSDKVVCEDGPVDLEYMTSRMEISVTNFASSTTRIGTMDLDGKTYDVKEMAEVILEDIQPVTGDPPVIENPGETLIEADYPMIKIEEKNIFFVKKDE